MHNYQFIIYLDIIHRHFAYINAKSDTIYSQFRHKKQTSPREERLFANCTYLRIRQFPSARIDGINLSLFFYKLRRRASIVFSENAGEV